MKAPVFGTRRISALALGLPLTAALMAAAQPAGATTPGYLISLGVGTSDNIRRVPTDEESETLAIAGLQLDWRERTARTETDVLGDLAYVDYLQNTFGSEVVGNASGRFSYAIAPERLLWSVSDNFGQGRIDPLSASSPENRENINYFSTGPDLALPFGSTLQLLASGRYSKVAYQETPLDSDRYSGLVGLEHKLSAASSVSLNASRDSIRFDDTNLNPDYDRDSAYARYKVDGRRTSIALDAGYSRIDRTVGENSDGVLFRLEVSRRISASSYLAASAGHEFSDAADAFRLSQTLTGGGLDTQSTVQTSSPFTNKYYTLGWNFARNRTGANLTASRFEESYSDNTLLDRKRTLLSGQLTRNLTPVLEAALAAAYSKEDYTNVGADAKESTAGVQLNWRAGRYLTISARYQYAHRTSNLPGTGFSENRTWLQFGWGRPSGELITGPARPALPGDVSGRPAVPGAVPP